MTEWIQATFLVRNAELFTNEAGDWVKAEFDSGAITEFVVPMVLPTLVAELVGSEDFVSGLVDTITPQMSLKLTSELMEHMTPEELSAVWSRFGPPGGPSSD